MLDLDPVLGGPPGVAHPQDVLIALVRLLQVVHPQHRHVLVLRRRAPGPRAVIKCSILPKLCVLTHIMTDIEPATYCFVPALVVESPDVPHVLVQCPHVSDDPAQVGGVGIRMEGDQQPGLLP